MAEIVPTVGRIVLYRLSEADERDIRMQREGAGGGNRPDEGSVYPAIIVKTWGDAPDSAVNLKVMLDGTDTLWVTSRVVGDQPGNYHWMEYQKKTASGEIAPNLHAQPKA